VIGRPVLWSMAPKSNHKNNRKILQGYEPFGALLPGRNYSSSNYNSGFNGKRKDDEIHGVTGTSYDFGARLLDPRVGRWLNIDPVVSGKSLKV